MIFFYSPNNGMQKNKLPEIHIKTELINPLNPRFCFLILSLYSCMVEADYN